MPRQVSCTFVASPDLRSEKSLGRSKNERRGDETRASDRGLRFRRAIHASNWTLRSDRQCRCYDAASSTFRASKNVAPADVSICPEEILLDIPRQASVSSTG